MRRTESKFIEYQGITICPKCKKRGYQYVKQYFDGSRQTVVSHRHDGICYV